MINVSENISENGNNIKKVIKGSLITHGKSRGK